MSKLTLSFKGKVLKVFPVLKGSMMLGSDPGCTIHIDSLALQPEHAQIDTVNNESVIRDPNTDEGTFIGQTKLESLHPLKDGDVIELLQYLVSADLITIDYDKVHLFERAKFEQFITMQKRYLEVNQ